MSRRNIKVLVPDMGYLDLHGNKQETFEQLSAQLTGESATVAMKDHVIAVLDEQGLCIWDIEFTEDDSRIKEVLLYADVIDTVEVDGKTLSIEEYKRSEGIRIREYFVSDTGVLREITDEQEEDWSDFKPVTMYEIMDRFHSEYDKQTQIIDTLTGYTIMINRMGSSRIVANKTKSEAVEESKL